MVTVYMEHDTCQTVEDVNGFTYMQQYLWFFVFVFEHVLIQLLQELFKFILVKFEILLP